MRRAMPLLTILLIGAAGVAVATNALAAGSADRSGSDAVLSDAPFAALGGLRHPAPTGLIESLDSAYYAERFAPNISAARLVKGTLAGDEQVWLVPGRGAVCLFLARGVDKSASCQSNEDAAAGHLIMSISHRGQASALVAGVLPNDIVSVDLVGQSARTVAVDSNVFLATTDAELASFVDGQGRSQQVTIPRADK